MRYRSIDIARGIAILLVVLGHSFSSADCPMNKMILGFHMPLFFFLSGVFAKCLDFNELWGGVKRKAHALLIPHILLSVTLVLFNGGLWIADGNKIADFNVVSNLFYWFLPVLFSCSVLFMLLSSTMNLEKNITRILIVIATVLCVYLSDKYLNSLKSSVLYWIRIVPTAFLFYFMGFIVKNRLLSLKEKHTSLKGLIVLVLITSLFVLTQVNSPIMMYKNEYGNYFLFLTTSLLGVYIVMQISRLLESSALLEEMGKLSIAIYVWNFCVIGFFYRLTNVVMKYTGLEDKGIMTAITFGIAVICLYVIAKLTYEKMPFLYGGK